MTCGGKAGADRGGSACGPRLLGCSLDARSPRGRSSGNPVALRLTVSAPSLLLRVFERVRTRRLSCSCLAEPLHRQMPRLPSMLIVVDVNRLRQPIDSRGQPRSMVRRLGIRRSTRQAEVGNRSSARMGPSPGQYNVDKPISSALRTTRPLPHAARGCGECLIMPRMTFVELETLRLFDAALVCLR